MAFIHQSECRKGVCRSWQCSYENCAELVGIDWSHTDHLIRFLKDNKVDLVVVGPEAPLVAGLADALHEAGIPVFGPSKAAAQLEGSKVFAKDLMKNIISLQLLTVYSPM